MPRERLLRTRRRSGPRRIDPAGDCGRGERPLRGRLRASAAALGLCAALWAGCKKPASGERLAILTTSKGVIEVRLLERESPRTVAHFVALATGTKPWRDPRTGKTAAMPLYDGLLFHRVIPGFMIQTGDPLGTGEGDIGVAIADEFSPALRFDRPGRVGLANFGPDTGSGQFFITLSPQPDLDGRHAIFGQVVEGMDVANAIANVPRDTEHEADRPLKPVVLETVRIVAR